MELERRTLFQRRWLLGLSALILLSFPFFFLGSIRETLGLLPKTLLVGGWITSVVFAMRRPLRRLRMSRETLTIDRTEIPRDAIRAGWFSPSIEGSPARVVLDAAARIEIDVEGEGEARRILAALELDVTHRAIRFKVEPPPTHTFTAAKALGFVLTFCALFFASKGAVYLLAFPALLGATFLWGGYEVHVGTDGVLTTSRFRRRFYPIDTITDATLRGQTIALVTTTGTVPIAQLEVRAEHASKEEMGAAILQRIREAKSAHATDRQARVAELLDRRDQSIPQWLERLASFTTAGYREIGIRREEIVGILDHHASSWARLGAAIVLARDPDERPRVRASAEACAEPHLRVALDAAARGDDYDALAEMSASLDEPRTRSA